MNRQTTHRWRSAALCRAARRQRRGSAILEFALVSPLLISLALLCIDFGRLPFYYIAVTNAARAGAGYASANAWPATAALQTSWGTAAKNAATTEFAANMESVAYVSSNLVVSVDGATASPYTAPSKDSYGYYVTVKVTYPFQTLIDWRWLAGYSNSISLSRTVVMRTTVLGYNE